MTNKTLFCLLFAKKAQFVHSFQWKTFGMYAFINVFVVRALGFGGLYCNSLWDADSAELIFQITGCTFP